VDAELPPEPASTPVSDTSDVSSARLTADPPPVPAQEVSSFSPAPTLEHHDRGTGLLIFGVAQIILGLLAALMIPLMALGAFMSRLSPHAAAMRPGQYISSVSIYGFIAVALVTLGIGSTLMKRWARALTLVISWYGLVMGVLITILLTAVLPVTMRTALHAQQNGAGTSSPAVTTGIMAVIVTVMIVFIAFFLIVVPVAFVIFYSRKDVEQTCRHHDQVERWTDRTPLPVLAASVILAAGAAYLALLSITTPLFPFFGRYLSGPAGSVAMLALAALDAYLAVALFRLKYAAWWIAVITVSLRLVSMFVTYGWADLMQAYSKMGLSDSQLQVMRTNPIFRSHAILWWSLIWMIGSLGYLLWLKRYFNNSGQPPERESVAVVGATPETQG
jgi:hypothetical protein